LRSQNSCFLKTEITLTDDHVIQKIDLQNRRGRGNAPASIGKLIDDAMLAIEVANASLKGVLAKDYNRPALDKVMLGELIDLISGIAFQGESGEARDVLGRVYEYFLGGFAGSEGKRGGEFYTPRSVVRVLVEMLEPFPKISPSEL
jgi:type I restriction enzyme M protein